MRTLTHSFFFILILIITSTPSQAESQPPLAPFPFEAPYTHQYQKQQFFMQKALSKAQMFSTMQRGDSARTANMDLYDVTFYILDLEPDPVDEILSGFVTVQARVLDTPLETMDLNLQDHMTVSSVAAGGSPATFNHNEHILTITLDRIYQPDEMVTVIVEYSGDPVGDHFRWNEFLWEPLIWTLSEPYGARHWVR